MHSKSLIPFTVTAANLNLADTTPYTITATLGSNSGLIRVPTRLELTKAAGTAYSLSNISPKPRRESRMDTVDSLNQLFLGGGDLIVEARDSAGRVRPFFFVPAEGFLDQATEQSRVVLPFTDGAWFKKADHLTFRLRIGCNIASGTGSLKGRLYFDEYSVEGLD
jgi:hypothetical protein